MPERVSMVIDLLEALDPPKAFVVRLMADVTGMRPNCLVELGYALGRGLPTMLHPLRHPPRRVAGRLSRSAQHTRCTRL